VSRALVPRGTIKSFHFGFGALSLSYADLSRSRCASHVCRPCSAGGRARGHVFQHQSPIDLQHPARTSSARTAIVCFVPILRAMERTFQTHTVQANFRTRRPQTLQRNLCTRRFLCHAHKTQADTHARIKSITFFIAVRERMRAPRLHQGKLCLFGMYNTFVAVIRTSDQSVFIPAARGRMRIPLAPPGEGIQFLACVMHFYSVKHQSNHFSPVARRRMRIP
jgi:hypothetical protein